MAKVPYSDLSLLESHPHWNLASKVYQILSQNGFKTYLAGGCVRDMVLKVSPKDLDIATEALPEQIRNLFPKTVDVGESFGVIRVIEGPIVIEVATFRTDGEYKDGRRPLDVIYSNPQMDAERRDFTVNALFYDLNEKCIIDYVHGLEDLKKQILRTVGSAEKRFQEDHLRILRAIRFAAQLDFAIESETASAVQRLSPLLTKVSGERIREEIERLLISKNHLKGLHLLESTGALGHLFPLFKKTSPVDVWSRNFATSEKNNFISSENSFRKWLRFFWPLYLSGFPWEEIEKEILKIRPSREEKQALQKAANELKAIDDVKRSSLGEQIVFYADPVAVEVLSLKALEEKVWLEFKQKIEGQYQRSLVNGVWPEPYLKGEDVLSLSGRERGIALKKAFTLQLEGVIKSREEALQWCQAYGQSIKK